MSDTQGGAEKPPEAQGRLRGQAQNPSYDRKQKEVEEEAFLKQNMSAGGSAPTQAAIQPSIQDAKVADIQKGLGLLGRDPKCVARKRSFS